MTEETIFEAALGKRHPAEREAYLEEACAGDIALRQRVAALLASHERIGDFLEHPALAQLAASPPPEEVTGAEPHDTDLASALGFLEAPTRPGSLGRLAHYEVLEVLGKGGFGIVLKAFDVKLHRMVALKVMAPHLAATSPPRKRFLREARAAAAIRHENVVTIHAVEEQPIPYLVMEYIAGETLQDKLERMGPLDVVEVLRLGEQIAWGLAAAHAEGLIHRDIKPGNILLEHGAPDRVKITDFGLARTADDASVSQSGVIAGTPLYMAPEQARGDVIDQRADLFSLGSVLYVMCSGRPPFRAANTLGVLKRVAEDTPRPIREIIPEIPQSLCDIVARLHAKKPEDRFASAREVADLLARHRMKLQQDRNPVPFSRVPQPAHEPAPGPGAGTRDSNGSRSAPAVPRVHLRKRVWAPAAACLAVVLVGLSLSEATGVTNLRGTVIRILSPEGTLIVEVDDPGVNVTLDGRDIVITGTGAREIRLRPGQHQVEARKDGKVVTREVITVLKDGRQVVRVSTEGGPGADAGPAEKTGSPPAANPPVKRPLDLRYIPSDASAAFVIHPRQIVQSPVAANTLPPGASDEMLKGLGVRPAQIEQLMVLLQVGTPARPSAAPMPVPAAILRLAEGVDRKQVLTRLLKGLREEKHQGMIYYRSSTGEEILGQPLAGAIPDEHTILLAPEPVLQKMLTAQRGARSPLIERLRQADEPDAVTGIVLVEPYRSLLKPVLGKYRELLPASLADAVSLPDHLVAVTAAVNLADRPLLKVTLEADNEDNVEALDRLAFQGLRWARKVYPDFRPTLLAGIPADVVQPALAIVDQLHGGIQVMKEGKRLVVRLERPEGFGTPPEKDLIASSGFNDARGMNSNPVPGSPFVLDTPNLEGGIGEPGWKGPWLAHPKATFQSKSVFEGDGALYLEGSPNFGPNYGRQLVQAQTGSFQVEYHVKVPAGSSYGGYLWQDRNGGAFASGPNWGAGGGKFTTPGQDTGPKCIPGKWYTVTLRIDVPKQTWEMFVDGRRVDSPRPLRFRTKVQYLDYINFLVVGGVYFDDLRITRLPDPEK